MAMMVVASDVNQEATIHETGKKRSRRGRGRRRRSIDDLQPDRNNSAVNREAVDDMDLVVNEADDPFSSETVTSDGYDPILVDEEEDGGEGRDHGGDDGDKSDHATAECNSTSRDEEDAETDMRRAQRLTELPLADVARRWGLASFLVENLSKQDPPFTNFFPIQTLVIPKLLYQHRVNHTLSQRCRDVCLQASTGAGKTVAYLIPILQALHESTPATSPHLLRALIVLPSRDLAIQVHAVCRQYAFGSTLHVALAVGQSSSSVVQEQIELLSQGNEDLDVDRRKRNLRRLQLEPRNIDLVLDTFRNGTSRAEEEDERDGLDPFRSSARGRSPPSIAVDILVCTPGRLVDHLDSGTFTLEHLRYLVVDEADRLLSQRYHNWIDRVLRETSVTRMPPKRAVGSRFNTRSSLPGIEFEEDPVNPCRFRIKPVTWRHEALRPSQPTSDGERSDRNNRIVAYKHDSALRLAGQPVQLQKFLVSATLTRDPQKLAALRLNHPIQFSLRSACSIGRVDGVRNNDDRRYALPPNLKEYAIECTAEQRPLVLLALLLERLQQQRLRPAESSGKLPPPEKIVIFTSSVDSTHRLARLLQLLWMAGVSKLLDKNISATEVMGETHIIAEVSSSASSLSAQDRFSRLQSRSIIVCSDSMSRGMDLPRVSLVVNYDVPRLAKTYVHRCGRTARAGQPGTAVVLLKKGQQPAFSKMRSLIVVEGSNAKSGEDDAKQRNRETGVEAMAIPKSGLMRDAIPLYRKCLGSLRRVLLSEQRGELGLMDEDPLRQYLVGDGE
jgi:ATP-dependent RNA helicase DDX51/DBP6